MNLFQRIARHARLTSQAYWQRPSPPLLVLFINSLCNMQCEHCFYWTSLNRKDDLTRDELFALSDSLGSVENLNLSGGEPFLRVELADICRKFIQTNHVRQIYVPTNGYFLERTVGAVTEVLRESSLELFAVELSLDGMPEFHDRFRVAPHSFRKAMETYDALASLQRRDRRLRIHAISTATSVNLSEIRKLTTYLYDRCPAMDHHNLAMIRGDRKNASLASPQLDDYRALYGYVRRLWAPRETGRYGSIVEPMLQWAKVETVQKQTQVVSCTAGRLLGVVYANGDVGVCELHPPLGNLRERSFPDIWRSEEARRLRASIANKDCFCTTEAFLWPSIVYQPLPLANAVIRGGVWQRPRPLDASERATLTAEDTAGASIGAPTGNTAP